MLEWQEQYYLGLLKQAKLRRVQNTRAGPGWGGGVNRVGYSPQFRSYQETKNSKIDIYVLREKLGTVNSQPYLLSMV